MAYPRDESSKWSHAVHKHAAKRKAAVEKALNDNAARGFSEPTGPTLQTILAANQDLQGALTEENAKIYADQRERILDVENFALKLAVEFAKLAMEWFKSELLRQLGIEAAEYDAQVDRWRGDIIRVNSEIEFRQVALIRAKADLEHEINIYKRQDTEADIALMDFLRSLATEDFTNKLDNIREVGIDNCQTIRDGARQERSSVSWTLYVQRIRKGTGYVVAPGGSGSFGNAGCI